MFAQAQPSYVLLLQLKGGLRDKPGKPADYYHSCYCLSGLSAAQHVHGGCVLGHEDNLLRKADPLINVVQDKLQAARDYFSKQPALRHMEQ